MSTGPARRLSDSITGMVGFVASMCENRTVVTTVSSHTELGRRIALGRELAGLTQVELADRTGLDRSVVAKIETGARRVSAADLVNFATVLDRPLDWFVVESSPSVVSRRTDPAIGPHSARLDARVERVSRDVAFLVREGILPQREARTFSMPTTFADAEKLAAEARKAMGEQSGPLLDLQTLVERVGLLAFAFELEGDGAYVEVEGWGAAVVASVDAGRRRFSLAHELGHHLVGDAYAAEPNVGSSRTEKLLNAFAAHLLLPRGEITELWKSYADRRLGAVAIAARFRVSWSVVCVHLGTLRLISAGERDRLYEQPPTRGDYLEVVERWEPEMTPPSVPPLYASRVVSAYRAGRLTRERTVELLWYSIDKTELPAVEVSPIESFRREFEPMK